MKEYAGPADLTETPPPPRIEAASKITTRHPERPWTGHFSKDIKSLHSLGLSLQKSWDQQKKAQETTPTQASNSITFKQYIREKNVSSDEKTPNSEECLRNLLCFLIAWEEPELREDTDKKLRQDIKYKQAIDKLDRQSIHVGLFSETIYYAEAVLKNRASTKYKKKLNKKLDDLVIANNKKEKKKHLIALVKTSIEALKENAVHHAVHHVDVVDVLERNFEGDFEKSYKDAVNAIKNFKSPAYQFLNALGLFCAFFSALTCSLLTGGSIYMLVAGLLVCLGPWGIAIAAILAVVTFSATMVTNTRLFSKAVPKFLLKIASKGGITEFINEEGERQQLSRSRKLFLLLAAMLSFTVGISTITFTVTLGTKILLFLIPGLVAFPVAPAIILGILGTLVGIGITILMFNAFVAVAPIALSKIKEGIQQFFAKKRTISEWIGVTVSIALKAALVAFVTLGLYFSVFYGIPDLVTALSFWPTLGSIIGWISFVGQVPFLIVSVNNASNLIAKKIKACFAFCRSHPLTPTVEENTSEPSSTSPRRSDVLQAVVDIFLIIWNALGHGAPFVAHSTTPLACVAATANVAMSTAANITEEGNDNIERRAERDKKTIRALNDSYQRIADTITTTPPPPPPEAAAAAAPPPPPRESSHHCNTLLFKLPPQSPLESEPSAGTKHTLTRPL